ncbi:lactadherin-like [Montipora foliosa]|uniref:lactadherin-like n=1 Tax=Montipora foliosa TaxID=591990 RepID=UPI0035F17170
MIVCCSLQIYIQVVSLAMVGSFVSGDCIDWDLGMENGLIPDQRITASSAFLSSPVSFGRLNDGRGTWAAGFWDENKYLQIDLQSLHVICAVSTQGASRWRSCCVKTYYLQSSTDNKRWTDYKENGLVKGFWFSYPAMPLLCVLDILSLLYCD